MAKDVSLREERKAETRRRIQAAARTLIADKGFEATTMRGLAQAAGVGVGTIALHFRDKTSLLFSSFFDDIGEVSRRAIRGAPQDAPLREQFRHMLRTMYGYYGEHTLFLRSVVKEALFAEGVWKARFDEQLQEIVGEVAKLIETHKGTGEVRADVSGLRLAMVCWSLYVSGLINGLNRERFDVEDQVATVMGLLDAVLAGVLADKTGDDHGQA